MSVTFMQRWRQVQIIAYLQFWPVGQCESLQHSRHLLKGTTPQQCPDAQSESGTHGNPLALGAIHFLSLLKKNSLNLIRIRHSTKDFERLFKFQLRKKKSTYLQFEPDGQSESLQHSRHLLKGHTPQQFPESHWLSLLHFPPFGLPETWFSNKISIMQITRNIGRKIMIPYTFNTSIEKKKRVLKI